jgi:hypothetical protein
VENEEEKENKEGIKDENEEEIKEIKGENKEERTGQLGGKQ